jgi:DNA-binding NtrC family response regulator
MRIDLQAKLLRAIQEHEIERVGGQGPLPVDVRIVATTNRDLPAEVAAGRFREDLYFRLEVVPLRTPPLRARCEDVPLLLEHLLHRHAAHHGLPIPRVEPGALELLINHAWPGNVRELSNVVERALIMAHGSMLGRESFERVLAPRSARRSIDSATFSLGAGLEPEEVVFDLRTLERRTIAQALSATGGHRAQAAQLLGISERTLRSKLNSAPRQP